MDEEADWTVTQVIIKPVKNGWGMRVTQKSSDGETDWDDYVYESYSALSGHLDGLDWGVEL